MAYLKNIASSEVLKLLGDYFDILVRLVLQRQLNVSNFIIQLFKLLKNHLCFFCHVFILLFSIAFRQYYNIILVLNCQHFLVLNFIFSFYPFYQALIESIP